MSEMDEMVERFLKSISVENTAPYASAYFEELESVKGVNRVIGILHLDSLLSYETYAELFEKIGKMADSPSGFEMRLSFTYTDPLKGFESLLDQYTAATSSYELGDYQLDRKDRSILFLYSDPQDRESLISSTETFQGFLNRIGCPLKAAVSMRMESESPDEDLPIEDPDLLEEPILDEDDGDYMPDDAEFFRDRLADLRSSGDIEYQKPIPKNASAGAKRGGSGKYIPAAIADLDNLDRVEVTGKIFLTDDPTKMRVSRSGKHIFHIEYSDGTNSIGSTIFESKRIPLETIDQLRPGVKIRVRGQMANDKYTRELTLSPDTIDILPPDPLREDPSPEKRVELHLHTNMSALDGIASIETYASAAQRFGMKALGITDHGVVQAFPEAQKAGKKHGIKMLYGTELYMVDDVAEICINPRDINLRKATYVIFDLETTGLSSRYDRIIEFGATKYCRGQRLDSLDFFINPDRKLRDVIINKTRITQNMVDSGRPIKEALKTIIEFFGDAVLVAHNATFDVGFINEALRRNGMEPLTNPVIDTLPLARYINPKRRSHTLEAVARSLNIPYDETEVHRAIYDAEILESVFSGLFDILSENDRDLNMMSLVGLSSKDLILNARPKHVVCYAKNEQGLKDLYRIISLSSTEYLSDVPKTPRSLIQENRENLLIGSACFNGEVFENALTRSEGVLKDSMDFYDYIEVQPPGCYSWLINDGQISSEEDLEMIIRDLISAAEDKGKTVVATGDCHYCEPEDKIYRDVYIFAKGIKGVNHPLNPPRRKRQKPYPNPDQHFRTTQEMLDDFRFLGDEDLIRRIVIDNTVAIADSLEEIKPTKDRLYPPSIPDADKNLIDLVYRTARERYGDPLPEPIAQRLETELKGIGSNGYYVIYWIASVLVRKVNETGHLVGSRGSVGSSLVATMAGITEVNPLPPHWICPQCKNLIWADANRWPDGFDLPDQDCPECGTRMDKDGHDIPFETFLGFHADKVPDIDLNFPSDFQAQAHSMTRELLGAKNVFKAGTIQTTEQKNAVGYVKGFLEYQGIQPSSVRPAEIDRLAAGCVGVKRTTGQHPGGIIVIPNDMSVFDFTPYQYPANSEDATWLTTHYDFHSIHDNVLKFDELGHVDPYSIKMMSDMAGVDWKRIPFDDPETMSIFYSPDALHLNRNVLNQKTGALGLPEFGTDMGRRILEETQPRGFGDLVRISGLAHGTDVYAGNAQELILSGKATLRDVIGCRDDIMVGLHNRYGIPSDEAFTIMEFVRHGYFRQPGHEEQKKSIEESLRKYSVSEDYINSCKKIAYLFPKAHAAAYVTMAVRVAWFKVHYPEIYYAIYFTLRCDAHDLKIMQTGQRAALNWLSNAQAKQAARIKLDNREKHLKDTLTIYVEMTDRGIGFGRLSVTKSQATTFIVDPDSGLIIPPFSAVDSLGESMANTIVAEREKKPFDSVEDFENRCRISRTVSERLKDLGAYDDLHQSAQMTFDEFIVIGE